MKSHGSFRIFYGSTYEFTQIWIGQPRHCIAPMKMSFSRLNINLPTFWNDPERHTWFPYSFLFFRAINISFLLSFLWCQRTWHSVSLCVFRISFFPFQNDSFLIFFYFHKRTDWCVVLGACQRPNVTNSFLNHLNAHREVKQCGEWHVFIERLEYEMPAASNNHSSQNG